MKTSSAKLFLFAALLWLALGVRASESGLVTPVPASGAMGLVGQTYASLGYTHSRSDKPANAGDGAELALNQALNAGLDGRLTYAWRQSDEAAGGRRNQQTIGGALRAFNPAYAWGKPYVEAGTGYAWTKIPGTHEGAFVWDLAAGTEFQIAPAASVTPYVKYQTASALAGGSTWNGGVRANYWVDSQWAVSVGLNYNDSHGTGVTVGTKFRF